MRDRWGLEWQIAPRRLRDWVMDPDRARAGRVAEAMLKMGKIDIAALEAAAAEPTQAQDPPEPGSDTRCASAT